MKISPERTVIVAVTYNRVGLLRRLVSSWQSMQEAPAGIVVVDNASSDETSAFLRSLGDSIQVDTPSGKIEVPLKHVRCERNLGGSGGFNRGMEEALSPFFSSAGPWQQRWLWLMDDDVEVLPRALTRLKTRNLDAEIIHGGRLNPDNTPFFWRHRLDPRTGVHWPMRGPSRNAPVAETNVACFEGAIISGECVARVGLPDPQFFISTDDTTYGYLASRELRVLVCDEPLLRKTRSQQSVDLGVRHLNDASDLGRFFALRNRGLLGQYLKQEGQYRPAFFALGTALTAGKELARLVLVEWPHGVKTSGIKSTVVSVPSSLSAMIRGTHRGLKILASSSFSPGTVPYAEDGSRQDQGNQHE